MRAKTTVYLEPRQAKLLALIAADQKVTQAELIRKAIDQLIESTVLPLPSFVGMGERVDDTVSAANVKDWIRENWPKDYEAKLARNRVTSSRTVGVITLDTSAILALADPRDADHARIAAALRAEPGGKLVPAEILAEVDYMLRDRLRRGDLVVVTLLTDLIDDPNYVCQCETETRLPRIVELLTRYADLQIGLADAAVVACAEANGGRVLTLDRRDFDVIAGEGRLTVLP